MCGIAGIFDLQDARRIDEARLVRMRDSLTHRGPDDHGLHVEAGIGLAHRRLSIIDLDGGHQPLCNEDGSVVVVYNGEIYNFQELSRELAEAGHTFRTRCDTEVLVHAWESWGEECVSRLRGMFAFALWDRKQKLLFLARDRVGIKPLHYGLLPDGRLLFGSELKALLTHPELPRRIDPRAVEEYFAFGYVPDPKTIMRDVWKLPAGHTLTVRRGLPLPATRAYWDVPFRRDAVRSEADLEHELIDRLREAVRIRLISEVPLGAFLSGGVDSSAVVAMMAGASESPVKTCSISFPVAEYNEADHAARVSARYGCDHQVQEVNPGDFDLVDRLASLYDEPYADSSAMPTYRVCGLARRRVTVALSGDGGDENFAGYRRYRWHVMEERVRGPLPPWVRRPLFSALGSLYPKADWAPRVLRAKTTLQALARESLSAYLHSVSVVSDDIRARMYSDRLQSELQGYHALEVFRAHARNAPRDPLSLIQYLDFKTYLSGDILTKVDRASMAHSLEVRVPILDHELVEWISGIPPEVKLRNGDGKHIFKQALRPYLPDQVLYRDKMGFGVPLASWFRGPLREKVRKVVLGPTLLETGLFRAEFLRRIVGQHESGLRDHSATMWALLMFAGYLKGWGPN